MSKLTALIPCRNESANIRDCLESVKWVDEIFVVDSFSTDDTVDICRQYTDRVVQHEYISPALQKNWAIPQATHPWVLIVDADGRAGTCARWIIHHPYRDFASYPTELRRYLLQGRRSHVGVTGN